MPGHFGSLQHYADIVNSAHIHSEPSRTISLAERVRIFIHNIFDNHGAALQGPVSFVALDRQTIWLFDFYGSMEVAESWWFVSMMQEHELS